MVKAGSVEIVGNIDVTSIKQGLREMKRGLDDARTSAKASFGDLKRTGQAVEGIAKPLVKIGTALSATLLGIASLSPAVAPSLARMQTDFMRLSRILGEELKPVFEDLEVVVSNFTEFLDSDEGRGSIEGISNALRGLIGFATSATGAIESLAAASRNIEAPFIEGLGGFTTPEQRADGAPRAGADQLLLMGELAGIGAIAGTRGGPVGIGVGALAGLFVGGGINLGEVLFGEGGPLEQFRDPLRDAILNTPRLIAESNRANIEQSLAFQALRWLNITR